MHARGAVIHFLGRHQLRRKLSWSSSWERLEGLHVIVIAGEVATVYRSRKALQIRDYSRSRRSFMDLE